MLYLNPPFRRASVKMLLRRRISRKGVCILIVGCISLYLFTFLFGDIRVPLLSDLTELHKCPACYGVSICPELYSNQITLESHGLQHIFNAKNIFYGTTKSGKRVVLKKLAHSWELSKMEEKLCYYMNKPKGCNVNDWTNIMDIDKIMSKLVSPDYSEEPSASQAGLIVCPNSDALSDLLKPVIGFQDSHSATSSQLKVARLNALVMLMVNAEPILLQVLNSRVWPVPTWGGTCGRLIVVEHAGNTLTSLMHEPWPLRLRYAEQILQAAADFTYNHNRFRFYLMDWSLDNISVDERGRVRFVDLEDVVVLDKHASPTDANHWYMRHSTDDYGPGYAFSIERMCGHHLSDHNLWSACYVLAAGDSPLLLPVPDERSNLAALLRQCLRGGDRFGTVKKLQQAMRDIINEENAVR